MTRLALTGLLIYGFYGRKHSKLRAARAGGAGPSHGPTPL